MADYYSGWALPPSGGAYYRLHLVVNVTSQDIATNTSTLSWALYLEMDRSWGGFYGYGSSSGSAVINGSTVYSVPSSVPSSAWDLVLGLGSGSIPVVHTADGTKTVTVAASFNGGESGYAPGGMSLSQPMVLPTIPRATTPVPSTSTPATGAAVTLTLTPAVAGFSHRLHWAFQPGTGGTAIDNKIYGLAGGGGSASGAVEGAAADGVAGRYWGVPAGTTTPTLTIPHEAFTQAVDQDTRTVTVTVDTYNGATLIGTKQLTLQVTLAASQKPVIGGITHAEATVSPNVATLVGAYVQSVSKLALALTGVSGIHGSTVVSRQISVGGQVLSADGTTPNPISVSGTVPITATVVDSRGRVSTTVLQNVTVLAWLPPSFEQSAVVVRALSSGVTDEDDGTYLKVDPADFSASSLVVATVQKNKIEYRLSYRLLGVGSWTVDGAGWINLPDTPSVIRFTGTRLSTFGSALLGAAYEVLIEIRDVLATSSVQRTVPKAQVVLHLKGAIGVGIGARHSGAANPLEVWGRGKQASNGTTLQSILDLGDLATSVETIAGALTTKAVTPAGLVTLTATDARRGLLELATSAETITGTDATRAVTPAGLAAALRPLVGQIPTVQVGSGTFSIAPDGTVTFTGVSWIAFNTVFDGLGMDIYSIEYDFTQSAAIQTYARLRAEGVDAASGYGRHANYWYGSYGDSTAMSSNGSGADSGVMVAYAGSNPGRASGTLRVATPAKAVATYLTADFISLVGAFIKGFDSATHGATSAYPSISIVPASGTITGAAKITKKA